VHTIPLEPRLAKVNYRFLTQ